MSIRSTQMFAAATAVAVASLVTASADADLITFTYTGYASGTYGLSNTAFTNAAFTITGSALTQNRVAGGLYSGFYYQHAAFSTTVSIAGFTNSSVNSALFTETDPKGGITLVAGTALGSNVLSGNGPANWDMLTSVPTYSTGFGYSANPPTINTTIGSLRFTSFSGTGTFTATVTPAPGALALLGLAGLAKRRRR